MKTGLVLEGGGLRGIFTAGVLDVLMEEGIEFDGAIGVSAGAAFGSNYKSGQFRRSIRYNLRFAKYPRYSSIRSLLATGDLFNAQFCYHDIPDKHDPFDWETFYKNPMEFYLVATDVETGKPVYHLCDDSEDQYDCLEWFRASGSMPLVSRVVEVGGYKLLDGGVADSIPLRFMEEQGYERNLIILTRPADYVKKPNPLMPVIRRALSNYPEAVRAIGDRHIFYNQELAYVRQREAGKYAFVIRPEEELDIGRIEHDRYKIRSVYKEGRRLARRYLPAIRRFLAAAKAEAGSTSGSIIRTAPEEETEVKESLQAPASVSEAAAPAEEEPAPVEKTPAPAEEVPATVEKASEPAEEVPAPAEKASEPAEEVPAPVEEPVPEHSAGITREETTLPVEDPDVPNLADVAAPGEGDKTEASDESAGNTFVLRTSRGNRPGKRWKPGKMTSLKNKSSREDTSGTD